MISFSAMKRVLTLHSEGTHVVPHMKLIHPDAAQGDLKGLYAAVTQTFGAVPNFVQAMGNSPALLGGFLGLYGGLSKGSIDAATAERIALAMSEANSCQYCVSAHSALAEGAGLSSDEIAAARHGTSADAHAAAAVRFARAVLDNKGHVTAGEVDAVRSAGYDDAQIAEIIGHVGLNTLLNYFGKASRIDIDFPRVPALAAAAA
jgi:uncharacterized peroxidase-related enzyme